MTIRMILHVKERNLSWRRIAEVIRINRLSMHVKMDKNKTMIYLMGRSFALIAQLRSSLCIWTEINRLEDIGKQKVISFGWQRYDCYFPCWFEVTGVMFHMRPE
jgi:hypothetical protein